ncbi:MAG: hypothetical protein WCT12_22785 [Verrucomicrobiota bacterium]
MKRLLHLFALTAALAAATSTALAGFPEEVRQTLRLCTADIQSALARSGLPKDATIALLPIKRDSEDYALGVLKNAATGAGFTCVEGKEDPFVQEVFKEIEWDERKDDILDPATLAKFGKLKAAKLLMYGVVREATGGNGRGYVEIEAHISSIETKQHLWGQVFARRFYTAPEVTGLVDLDPGVRQLIRESFERGTTALKANAKLKDTRTIAIVPLAGDMDRFITGLAESMVSKTQFMPKQLDTATLGEARALLRDNPQAADAILYGAVRDLSRKLVNRYPDRIEYETSSAVQLTIQDAKTGNILWSDLIEASGTDAKQLSWWEMTQRYGPFVLAGKWYVITPVLVFIGLIGLFIFFRMMRRAR